MVGGLLVRPWIFFEIDLYILLHISLRTINHLHKRIDLQPGKIILGGSNNLCKLGRLLQGLGNKLALGNVFLFQGSSKLGKLSQALEFFYFL